MVKATLTGVFSEENDHKYLVKVFAKESVAEAWVHTTELGLTIEKVDIDISDLIGYDGYISTERPSRELAQLVSTINATLDFVNGVR